MGPEADVAPGKNILFLCARCNGFYTPAKLKKKNNYKSFSTSVYLMKYCLEVAEVLDSPRYICCEKCSEPAWLFASEVTARSAPFGRPFQHGGISVWVLRPAKTCILWRKVWGYGFIYYTPIFLTAITNCSVGLDARARCPLENSPVL